MLWHVWLCHAVQLQVYCSLAVDFLASGWAANSNRPNDAASKGHFIRRTLCLLAMSTTSMLVQKRSVYAVMA
jgi:hypothetical protein